MEPYLVQRASFNNKGHKSGIDSILSFSYMGSAEFEFGSLGKSLKAIRSNISEYSIFHTKCKGKKITVFCRDKDKLEISDIIDGLAVRRYRLKEYSDFNNFIDPTGHFIKCDTDFWWDIGNHFMFWRRNEKFTKKFEKLIK